MPALPLQRRTALESTQLVDVEPGYSFDFKTRFISYGFPASVAFTISVGDYSFNYLDGSWFYSTTQTLRFDLHNANVGEYPNSTGALVDQKFERSFTLSTQPLPEDAIGQVRITMNVPIKALGGSETVLVEVKSIELINTYQGNNIVGEFHTVNRVNPVSSIVKDNRTVSNGDSLSNYYTGALYKANGVDLTEFWRRQQSPGFLFYEKKPLLRIIAEDELRISQIPTQIFSGDCFGKLSYLGVYEINNIKGKFMPISYSYDTMRNITSVKNLELFCPEVADLDYSKTDDYGETVKPTITS